MLTLDNRRNNMFDRSSWRNKRILVMNHLTSFNPQEVELLRTLSGRDYIRYDRKYQQTNDEFRFEGVCILISNHPACELSEIHADVAFFF